MTSKHDHTWGLHKWLKGIAVGGLLTLRAFTTPSPSHRVAHTRLGVAYHVKSYQNYMADCKEQFAQQKHPEPLVGRLAALVETIVERPKTTKLPAPRGDSDNYAKAPLDAATQCGVWVDDTQIIPLATTKRWTEPDEEPGVILYVGVLN